MKLAVGDIFTWGTKNIDFKVLKISGDSLELEHVGYHGQPPKPSKGRDRHDSYERIEAMGIEIVSKAKTEFTPVFEGDSGWRA